MSYPNPPGVDGADHDPALIVLATLGVGFLIGLAAGVVGGQACSGSQERARRADCVVGCVQAGGKPAECAGACGAL